MAFFDVTVETIGEIRNHSNADRLDVAKLDGMEFQFVVGRGQYKPGDRVLYFPVDSVMPPELLERLGLTGKLAGKLKNRIKTIKLRGEISQGLVGPLELAPPGRWDDDGLADVLGVTKYEPEPVASFGCNLIPLPSAAIYDIEGADRYPDALAALVDVEVTEKLEGMNFSISATADGTVSVNQRKFTIQPIDGTEHVFWQTAREQGLIELAKAHPGHTFYGEFCGPGAQGNIYGLPKHHVYLFDCRKPDGSWMAPGEFALVNAAKVPLLHIGYLEAWLNGRSLRDASNGKSVLADTAREGVVIKPLTPAHHPEIGRLIIKQRSPEYLAGSDT